MKMWSQNVVAGLFLASVSVSSFASDWVIDPSHSKIAFSVKHLMVTNTKGEFSKYTGEVNLNEQDITKSKVEVSIDTASIDTREPKRDDHLRSPDFFDAAKYPQIKFVSTKVEKAPSGLKVTGDLTIKDQKKSVVLDVEGPAPVTDPWGNKKQGLSATTVINRKDFGLNWNKALETGGVVVGDEVKIALDIELNEKKPAVATDKAPKKGKK